MPHVRRALVALAVVSSLSAVPAAASAAAPPSYDPRGHSLAEVVGWMATSPATLIGVRDKGAIAVGRPADLVVFAPDASFTVDARQLRHKNPVTPYDGRTLDGVVRQTYLRGERVDTGDRPRGRLLARG